MRGKAVIAGIGHTAFGKHPGRDTVCPACGRKVIERDEQVAHNLLVRGGLCGACGEDLNIVDGWE